MRVTLCFFSVLQRMDDFSGRHSGGGAALRRRQRRLRSWHRHEQQTVAAALATYQHHSQRMARTRGGVRGEVHGEAPAEPPPPQAAGAVYYEMDTMEDDGSAPAAMLPAPLFEVLPQEGDEAAHWVWL